MSTPLVAIITRTKDRPRFLERAVESVLAQRVRDWVHVIVNDGGERGGVDRIVERAASRYEGRAQVVHHERAVGRGGAANAGAAASRSTLIVFHDDDDTWAPDFLEKAVGAWRSSGAKGVVSRSERVIERLEGDRLVEVRREPFFPDLEAVSLPQLARDNCFVNLAFLMERAAFEAAGPFDAELPVYEDWDFNLRFLLKHDVHVVPEVLARYHHREAPRGAASNSFAQERARVAAARARLVNRWLRNRDTQAVGLLVALGPTLDAVDGVRERVDKLFNLLHGVRRRFPLRQLESWLGRDDD
ncbi:MAG: glycosyltransferase [Myxococcota bacterium]